MMRGGHLRLLVEKENAGTSFKKSVGGRKASKTSSYDDNLRHCLILKVDEWDRGRAKERDAVDENAFRRCLYYLNRVKNPVDM